MSEQQKISDIIIGIVDQTRALGQVKLDNKEREEEAEKALIDAYEEYFKSVNPKFRYGSRYDKEEDQTKHYYTNGNREGFGCNSHMAAAELLYVGLLRGDKK